MDDGEYLNAYIYSSTGDVVISYIQVPLDHGLCSSLLRTIVCFE